MSVGVEVDALALMLDGALVDGARLGRVNVEHLEARQMYLTPLMERTIARHEWVEVAEAILELEACADWKPMRGGPEPALSSGLAHASLAKVRMPKHFGERVEGLLASDVRFLEAAALLRDGWRPRKRSKR